MKLKSLVGRRLVDDLVRGISTVASFVGIFVLAWILYVVALKGVAALNLDFFTSLPAPPGASGGGVANAILGSLIITLLATALGIPAGILGGVYLAEYARHGRIGHLIRFMGNVMMGIPSIIVGVFVYAVVVSKTGNFSAVSGALSLAIIMLPVVSRTTEEILRLVPDSLRESALALGATRWYSIVSVIFKAAKSGLITASLLAVARVSGETAPLLFTALNSPYWPESLNEPTANLTVTIFNYAMSPYDDWQRMAWGAALLITLAVLGVSVLTRILFREVRR